MNDITQLREIASALRQLQRSSPSSKESMATWEEHRRRFSERLVSEFSGVGLPLEIWHYLHDADLRLRDPRYRRMQERMIGRIVRDLEKGIVPASSGMNLLLSPRRLAGAGLILVALVLYWVFR